MRTYQEFVRPGGRGDGGGRDGPHRAPGGGGPPSRDAPSWAPQSGSRTPQVEHGAGSRTPAWMSNSGSRTPAWMAGGDGGRTPAYPAGGKTPAWGMDGSRTSYAGNRTPALVFTRLILVFLANYIYFSWNPSSRTPYVGDSDRSAWDAGSKTPGRPNLDAFMDAPAPSTYSARTPGAYNAASPEFNTSSYAKEISAPTPGNPLSAPTPSAMSAPTPGPISAPTPRENGGYGGGWADTAPTPAQYGAAPTPGASGVGTRDPRGGYYQGAPTPAAGYGPRTPGVWAEDEEVRYAEPTTP